MPHPRTRLVKICMHAAVRSKSLTSLHSAGRLEIERTPQVHGRRHSKSWKGKRGYPEIEAAAEGKDPESQPDLRSHPWLAPGPRVRGEDPRRPHGK